MSSHCFLLLGDLTVPEHIKQVLLEPDLTHGSEQQATSSASSTQVEGIISNIEDDPQNTATPKPSLLSQDSPDQNRELTYGLSFEPTCQSSFDPYGFKLSPEHSSHTLLDPDEAELSPELQDNDLTFNPEHSPSQLGQLNFDDYGFDIDSSQMARDSDPYGFKLSPEEENQEVLELLDHHNQETMVPCTFENNKQLNPSNCSNGEVIEPHTYGNQEVLEHCSQNNQNLLDLYDNGNQEVLEMFSFENRELVSNENQVFHCISHYNQQVVEPYSNISNEEEPYSDGNQEVLEHCSHDTHEQLDLLFPENQEVIDFDSHGNQELLEENQEVLVADNLDSQELVQLSSNENQELLIFDSYDNQEGMDLLGKEVFHEANNNRCIVEPAHNVCPIINSSDSSDTDLASEDLLGLELINTSTTNVSAADNITASIRSTNHDRVALNAPTRQNVLEGDLGSVFGAGGYIGCPDVADDLEPLDTKQANPVAEPIQPVRPVRPPRPSLRVSWESHTCNSVVSSHILYTV